MSETLGTAADHAGEATVRVPANLYSMIRASYDSREKQLDWILAICVVGAMSFAFRKQLIALVVPDNPNDALPDPPAPSQDLSTAFPFGGRTASERVYTYNMPSSRLQRYQPSVTGTRTPSDPSVQPSFDAEDTRH